MERRKGCDARAAAEIGVGSPMDVVALLADAGVGVDGDVGREEESEGVEGGEGVAVLPASPPMAPHTTAMNGALLVVRRHAPTSSHRARLTAEVEDG